MHCCLGTFLLLLPLFLVLKLASKANALLAEGNYRIILLRKRSGNVKVWAKLIKIQGASSAAMAWWWCKVGKKASNASSASSMYTTVAVSSSCMNACNCIALCEAANWTSEIPLEKIRIYYCANLQIQHTKDFVEKWKINWYCKRTAIIIYLLKTIKRHIKE